VLREVARDCPCPGAGVADERSHGWRSEVSIERAQGRMPAASVRRRAWAAPRRVNASGSRVTRMSRATGIAAGSVCRLIVFSSKSHELLVICSSECHRWRRSFSGEVAKTKTPWQPSRGDAPVGPPRLSRIGRRRACPHVPVAARKFHHRSASPNASVMPAPPGDPITKQPGWGSAAKWIGSGPFA